jgi:hypothetical protein
VHVLYLYKNEKYNEALEEFYFSRILLINLLDLPEKFYELNSDLEEHLMNKLNKNNK